MRRLHRRHLRAHRVRGRAHPAGHPAGMAERTVAIDSMSKTYSVTGWRVGWVIAAPSCRSASAGSTISSRSVRPRRCRPPRSSPWASPTTTTPELLRDYRARRDAILPALEAAGFRVHRPAGAYYVMTDIRDLTDEDDVTFARRLIADPGVAGRARLLVLLAPGARAARRSGSPSPSGSRPSTRRPRAWARSAVAETGRAGRSQPATRPRPMLAAMSSTIP